MSFNTGQDSHSRMPVYQLCIVYAEISRVRVRNAQLLHHTSCVVHMCHAQRRAEVQLTCS